jgi:hypothetical protein
MDNMNPRKENKICAAPPHPDLLARLGPEQVAALFGGYPPTETPIQGVITVSQSERRDAATERNSRSKTIRFASQLVHVECN